MAIYQTSKQITKFTISGVIAVFFDFAVYYGLSNLIGNTYNDAFLGLQWNDVYKGVGFMAGTFVTYNLNKFWTWRTSDKNNKRLANFAVLYIVSFVINILINKWGMTTFQDNEIALLYTPHNGDAITLFPFKTDKLSAFVLATAVSSIVNFVGQKIWVFKDRPSTQDDSE
jgi:putative flippase GtrA